MIGKTVEMRLTIFPATRLKTIHGFITIQWRIYYGARSRVGASTVPPPQPRGRAEEAADYPCLGGLPRRGGGTAVSGEKPR
jgi:hypothetical protein